MAITFILILSFIAQAAAAAMAFRMLRISGRNSAWGLVTIALSLMAVRRIVPLYHLLSGDPSYSPDLLNEFIGLVLSLVIAVGIGKMAPVFLERLREEKARRESEERYRSLIRNIHTAIVVHNGRGHIQTINPMAQDMLGLSEEQLLGKALIDYEWHFLREDGEVMLIEEYPVSKVLSLRQPLRGYVMGISRPDRNEVTWALVNAEPEYDDSGEILQVIVSFVDITELKRTEELLKKSEQRLSEAQSLAHIGSWDWDANTDKIWWSDAYYRIHGFNPSDPTPNYEEHLKVYTSESAERLDKAVKHSMETGEPYELDLELANPNATTRWIIARGEPKQDAAGKIWGLRGTAQNITERKMAEQEIKRLNEELERRVKERTKELEERSLELKDSQLALINIVEDLNLKGGQQEALNKSLQEEIRHRVEAQEEASRLNDDLVRQKQTLEAVNHELESFSYSVSHDLRAPLRAIDGFSQAVLEDYGDRVGEEGLDYLKRIRAASQRMGQLIDDILGLSRLSRTEMQIDDVDLSSIANQISNDLKAAHPGSSADIIIQGGMMAKGDARLLRIALENLLNNAWKFSSKTDSQRIEFGAVPKEGQPVYLVRDNGVGFDMAYSDKLFSPFQRLHSTDEFPGTGIGLTTVRRIIMRHKGQIWVESEPGCGATFYFTLGLQN